jgi:hypothetical protein
MSYQTLEVELDAGRVQPCGLDRLPEKARALLTILSTAPPTPTPDANASLADRVQDLAGIGCGQHHDLSTNRAHLDDLGR